MIEVVNQRSFNPPNTVSVKHIVEYIGRPSALGNPYRFENRSTIPSDKWTQQFKKDIAETREDAIEEFRAYLWRKMVQTNNRQYKAMERLAFAYHEKYDIYLCCYCAPLPCHGDVIKRAIIWFYDTCRDTFEKIDKIANSDKDNLDEACCDIVQGKPWRNIDI